MKESYVILGIVLGVIGLLTVWFCGWILIIIGIILFVFGIVAEEPPVIVQQTGYYQQPPGYYQQPSPYYQPPPPPQYQQAPQPGGPQYSCAYCGAPLTYVQQSGRWFCQYCNKYN